MSEPCERTAAAVARLEEAVAALRERLDREDAVTADRIALAKSHLDHRLDVLNHAHQQSLEDRAQYVTRVEIRWMMGTIVVILLALFGYILAAR